MPDKIIEKSPAKINLFLKIINRRDDGFHNIRTGITFIDLFDEITVQPHSKFQVIYTGNFAPKNNLFEDCIIDKLFTYINEDKPKLLFTISKNFPYEAGLGSASSNVASVIKSMLSKVAEGEGVTPPKIIPLTALLVAAEFLLATVVSPKSDALPSVDIV